jgi:lysozyme family protein
LGYRLYHPETLSPCLWGGANNYAGGKYVQDGRWSAINGACALSGEKTARTRLKLWTTTRS